MKHIGVNGTDMSYPPSCFAIPEEYSSGGIKNLLYVDISDNV